MKARGCSKRRDATAPLDSLVAANRQTAVRVGPRGSRDPRAYERDPDCLRPYDLAHSEPEDIALVVRGMRTACTVAENPL